MTMQKDGDEQGTKLMTHLHVSSLFQTLLPLPIIFQKTTCRTCSFEGGMQDAFKGFKVFQIFSTFDSNQEQPKIKLFSCRWVNKVYPSNNITMLTLVPLCILFFPKKVMREVNIRNLLCSRKGLIGCEPLCKSSLLYGISLHNFTQVIIVTEIDGLLIRKVNR